MNSQLYKKIFGFIILYPLILFIIPYNLFFYSHKTIFLTYIANVDIIANILSVNFPKYFKNYYNINPNDISQYIFFNFITLAALAGIFTYGIVLKNNNKHSDISILACLILMSIITWTLPTQLIPYLTKKIIKKLNIKEKTYDVFITTIISLSFIVIEGILIHYLVFDNRLFKNTFLNEITLDF